MKQHRFVCALVALGCLGPVSANVINGDFNDGLNNWTSAWDPASGAYQPTAPITATEFQTGIAGNPSPYAVLDSTLGTDNPIGTNTWVALSQNVTYGGVTGILEFRLSDYGDPNTPANNSTGVLLDNVSIANVGGFDQLSFDWYGLAKKENQWLNDVFTVSFDGQDLFSAAFVDLGMFSDYGGGGTQYGAFTNGTGWQNITVQPVPEPASVGFLLAGSVVFFRRRRRK